MHIKSPLKRHNNRRPQIHLPAQWLLHLEHVRKLLPGKVLKDIEWLVHYPHEGLLSWLAEVRFRKGRDEKEVMVLQAWEVALVIWMVCSLSSLTSPFVPCESIFHNLQLVLTWCSLDASVTQSALEEALASNMQAGGGMASRMSSISQALRSKYLWSITNLCVRFIGPYMI